MALFEIESDRKDLSGFVWAVYILQFLTPFTGGLAFVAGGIVAYWKHDDSIGQMEQSHFLWQIKTFWIGLGAGVVGLILLLIWIGKIVLAFTGLWIIYRAAKGGYYFFQKREIENSLLF